MVWRCLGRGFAAIVIAALSAMFVDQLWPLGSENLRYLVPAFIVMTAWWGSSYSHTLRQGALHGALTILAPATIWTLLLIFIQYELGGRRVFNIDHLYGVFFTLVIPVIMGAVVGAVVGYVKARRTASV